MKNITFLIGMIAILGLAVAHPSFAAEEYFDAEIEQTWESNSFDQAGQELPPFPRCTATCAKSGDTCTAVCKPGQSATCIKKVVGTYYPKCVPVCTCS